MTARRAFSRLSLLQAASVLCLAAAGPAFAQSAPAEATAQEETEIVVTARRREESLIDVPIAITTQSAEQLEMRGAPDITALQRSTPNLTLQVSRGTNSTLTAFIRGVGQQDPLWGFEPGVGLYVDDVYIARPQGAVLDIFDIERIEVLRGPQGTLYGRNTIGGAIKYVTRRLTDDPEFRVRANVGEYNQRDLILSGSIPLGDYVRIGGAFATYNRDGFGTNHFTGADTNDRDVVAGRLTLEVEPSSRLFFRLSADHLDDDSNINHGHRERAIPAAFGVPPLNGPPFNINIPAGAFPVQGNEYDTWAGLADANEVITQGASLLAEWQPTDVLTFKSITAYREGETNSRGIDFDGTPAPILDVGGIGSLYTDHQLSQEFQLALDFDRWRGVVGIYYMDASAAGKFDTTLGVGASAIPGAPSPALTQGTSGSVDTESFAIFGDFEIDLTERFALSLGARWTQDDKTAEVYKANYFGIGSPISGVAATPFQILTNYRNNETFEEFTPRVSLSYALAEDMNLYVAYSRGFKSGGFDMRGDAFATPATADGYAPETVDSYELGLRGLAFDNRLRFSGAIFHAAYEGQQVTSQQVNASGTGVVSFVDNVGSSTINGAELELHARLTSAFSLDFNVGYIDASFDEFLAYVPNPSAPPAYVLQDVADQRQFQNTPDWNGQLALNYLTPLFGGDLNVRGSVSFRSDVSMFESPAPEIDQPGYELYDLSLVWTSASNAWRVGLHGRNLTDERYRTGGYYFTGLAFGDSVIGFYGAPRTVFASLEYRY